MLYIDVTNVNKIYNVNIYYIQIYKYFSLKRSGLVITRCPAYISAYITYIKLTFLSFSRHITRTTCEICPKLTIKTSTKSSISDVYIYC